MKTKILKFGVLSLAIFGASAHANIVDFDITVQFGAGLTQSQEAVFTSAENFWETNLIGYAAGKIGQAGLVINAVGEYIDGVGSVLGSAGPEYGYGDSGNGYFYATEGSMTFDSADLTSLENQGTLLSVIIHEMAHVIGFGTLWGSNFNDVYNDGTGQYTGLFANDAYRAEFDANALFVPVELDGGAGTAGGHWDEAWAGPTSDILTGFLEGATTVSETTLAAFRDLGYVTAALTTDSVDQGGDGPNDVFAPTTALLTLSLLGLTGLRRKRV